jgi:hypothetical protein
VLMAAARRRIYNRNGEAGKTARARKAPAGNAQPAGETGGSWCGNFGVGAACSPSCQPCRRGWRNKCIGPLGSPSYPTGQSSPACPWPDPNKPIRTFWLSKMDRPAGDALRVVVPAPLCRIRLWRLLNSGRPALCDVSVPVRWPLRSSLLLSACHFRRASTRRLHISALRLWCMSQHFRWSSNYTFRSSLRRCDAQGVRLDASIRLNVDFVCKLTRQQQDV